MKPRWLNRTLVLGPYLTLCLSEKEYRRAAKHVRWPKDANDPWCSPGDSARAHMGFGCEHPTAIICMSYTGDDAVMVAGLLAHEATHIWQDWLASMGEDAPGDEVSAYAVQNLVVLLMSEWARRMTHV